MKSDLDVPALVRRTILSDGPEAVFFLFCHGSVRVSFWPKLYVANVRKTVWAQLRPVIYDPRWRNMKRIVKSRFARKTTSTLADNTH